ncbi:glycosyltransferase [Saccharospirillum alexandrii]|uniref:glycosyltransferase n=1 Tax=Saccharospirillum alexandrii TaxID=2448477 RepID=UPI000FDAC576|nr:glycosyltransferase [Saccharospirillum alexandrii]
MKLKEYPVSAWHSAALWLTPVSHLLSKAKGQTVPVVVSFTSIPSRLPILHLTVRSLLRQTVHPEKLVLWLHHDLKPQVPERLNALQNELFEIRYADQTCAHRKLVHALAAFPGKTIVTCDDDLLYRPNWLATLYQEHQNHPDDVIGHECRRIHYSEQGDTLPYAQWRMEQRGTSHRDTLAIGFGGTLYPANRLHRDTTDPKLYLNLAPRADDLWFKAMSLLNGTQTRRSEQPPRKPIPIIRSQAEALGKTNIKLDQNRTQWNAIREHYDLGTATTTAGKTSAPTKDEPA